MQKVLLKWRLFLGELKVGTTKINHNGLAQVNITRSVFFLVFALILFEDGSYF